MGHVLIIGIGNPLCSDDGVGQYVAQQLASELPSSESGVQVIATHQLTPEFADLVSRADRVLMIDAAHNRPPGNVLWEPVVPAAEIDRYSHSLSPAAVVRLAEMLFGRRPPTYLLTVAGEKFDTGETLSATVLSALGEVRQKIREFLEAGK